MLSTWFQGIKRGGGGVEGAILSSASLRVLMNCTNVGWLSIFMG